MLSRSQSIEPGLPERETRLEVFQSIVSDTKSGVVVTTPDGHAVYVNPAFTEITGYSRDHVLGKNMRILQSGRQSQSFYEAMWQTLRTEGAWSGTITLHDTPRRRAFQATPWAMLPALAV